MRKEPDRRSFLLPPLSLNCRLRDPGRSSCAGLKSPACPAQQRCSAAVAAVRPPGGPGASRKMKTGRAGKVPVPSLKRTHHMQIMKADPRALKENPDRMRQSKSSPQADVLMLATIKAVGIVHVHPAFPRSAALERRAWVCGMVAFDNERLGLLRHLSSWLRFSVATISHRSLRASGALFAMSVSFSKRQAMTMVLWGMTVTATRSYGKCGGTPLSDPFTSEPRATHLRAR
jgi:hypothetical protein